MSGLLDRFRSGDRLALARILSHVENQTGLGRDALKILSQQVGHAHLIGLTGPPGAGKSTLANRLVREFLARDQRIAVLAIDPSSPFSGGATLGDRIRMLESQDDDNVYLRSMASRGQIGGLAIAAFGSAIVLDAFGFDVVLIETVGTGQDEVDIASLADTVLLVQTPGLGDSIQAVKAGILEIADVIAVNKSDLPGADEVVRDLRQIVRSKAGSDWRIPVLSVVAEDGTGVPEIVDETLKHRDITGATCSDEDRRRSRFEQHARMMAVSRLNDWLRANSDSWSAIKGDDPVSLSDKMLRQFARDYVSEE